ncbi:phosphoserine phosphatase SerB [Pseudidiomarina terrestris]|uniref:Phosphoserine phosphatase n=1 Tax=Pseudidiomarina terrestris TaxID=2820060 RepID=A0ABT8ML60_9GAMM|nr:MULTISPECIES: phosphoserine phosphatase SerB [unclassified Pseudidiomarina]MDN7128135.1 phosphoserine phosphatase SerB [Pseudidiomarina sp. 1APR75-33.1]MDN7130667.1 phosphoserine phosphatase SerB [Pseudidiomarina sp. 1APR75-15]MDN7136582.1 phosphoserine phosphatase SerB [Pseudidiomarina sp. 1ASP75-5]
MVDIDAPGIVLFDMDSTLITIECIDELAALVGKKQQVSAVTEAAMRGELDFAESLRARVKLLAGVHERQLQQLLEPIPFSVGAQALIAWFQQRGWRTALVSGGFTWFSGQVAEALKLDAHKANQLQWQQHCLTGTVAEPIVDGQSKADYLHTLAQRWQLPMSNTIAVGDGANDKAMLQAAGLGIAYCAKPALQEVADWCIQEPDLMQLANYLETMKSRTSETH